MQALFQFLDAHPYVFTVFFFLMAGWTLSVFYFGGKRAEKRFSPLSSVQVQFRERGVSGHSKKSALTQLGGARNALDVVVTTEELWIRGILPMFSYVGTYYDLIHCIPISDVLSVQPLRTGVEVRFKNDTGQESTVVLYVKDKAGFIAASTEQVR